MVYLKNNILTILTLLLVSTGYSQSYTYSFTDPCTLERKSILIDNPDDTIVFNYFGQLGTFTGQQVQNGTFDNWMLNVSQQYSNSPCDEVTQVIINNVNNVTTANTLTITTNIMSVMGGGMLPPAESINNSTSSGGNDSDSSSEDEGDTNTKTNGNNTNQPGGQGTNQTNQNNQETQGNQSSTQSNGGTSTETTGESGNTTNTTQGGEQTSESSVSQAEGSSSQSTANSLSNAIDGGAAGGGGKKKSNKAQKQAGSLIASGDVVVISNTDNTQQGQMRFVGSITHANTTNTRIKGALFTYTTRTNDLSLTFYKSWINPKKTFNLVIANTTLTNFKSSIMNTTTALESFRFGKKKFTGMFGLNFTYGKLGERTLQNLSSVGGIHRGFKINHRLSTSLLVLGVYSPFTQFYDGKWWDAGVLVVPFNSWDIKITKTFKYNISFTGVYESSGNFLNYQILTGGKLNF